MSVKEITHILKNLGEPLSDAELEAAIKAMEPDNESQVGAVLTLYAHTLTYTLSRSTSSTLLTSSCKDSEARAAE